MDSEKDLNENENKLKGLASLRRTKQNILCTRRSRCENHCFVCVRRKEDEVHREAITEMNEYQMNMISEDRVSFRKITNQFQSCVIWTNDQILQL